MAGGMRKGQANGGVRDFEDLRQRSVIDEVTGCWNVRAATSEGSLYLWCPAAAKVLSLPALIGVLKDGKVPPKGRIWLPTCANKACGNPLHRKLGTVSEYRKLTRPVLSLEHRQRISKGMRASEGCRYCPKTRAEIMASDENAVVIGNRLGFHPSTIRKIRAGLMWRDAAPAASVFSFAPLVLKAAA